LGVVKKAFKIGLTYEEHVKQELKVRVAPPLLFLII
jgi:hypothetical protein